MKFAGKKWLLQNDTILKVGEQGVGLGINGKNVNQISVILELFIDYFGEAFLLLLTELLLGLKTVVPPEDFGTKQEVQVCVLIQNVTWAQEFRNTEEGSVVDDLFCSFLL